MAGPVSHYRNPFPRQSSGKANMPDAINAEDADGRDCTARNLDQMAGEGNQNKPKLRGMEVNTADGRTSRYGEVTPTDRRSGDVGTVVDFPEGMATYVTEGYGETAAPMHSQGSMPVELPGGPSLEFDD
jgi:hypothetical protein